MNGRSTPHVGTPEELEVCLARFSSSLQCSQDVVVRGLQLAEDAVGSCGSSRLAIAAVNFDLASVRARKAAEGWP